MGQYITNTENFPTKTFFGQYIIHTENFPTKTFLGQYITHTENFPTKIFLGQYITHTENYTTKTFLGQYITHKFKLFEVWITVEEVGTIQLILHTLKIAIGVQIKDVSKSLWQISLTLTPRWNAVKLRFCPIFSTNLGIPFNRDLDCIKRQLFPGTSEYLASWRHTLFDTLVSLSILNDGSLSGCILQTVRDDRFVSRCLGGGAGRQLG